MKGTRQIFKLVALVCMLTITPLQAFAANVDFSDLTLDQGQTFEQPEQSKLDDNSAVLRDSKHTIRKEYSHTLGPNTYYNNIKNVEKGATKKLILTQDVYKVYYVYVATGNKTFQYDEYHWSWDGYEKINGVWKYAKSDSGIQLRHVDATDAYGFLGKGW